MSSGVDLVGNTGKALQEIVGQVVQGDSNVGAIVEASKEQSTGLKEINTAVNTMDQGTQQNAAMVEETSATVQYRNRHCHPSHSARRLWCCIASGVIGGSADDSQGCAGIQWQCGAEERRQLGGILIMLSANSKG